MHPDYVIIDLDPSDNDFKKAIEAARAAKTIFDKYKLVAFPKTSGKTGIHLYLPCQGFTFPQARIIAEKICSEIHGLIPNLTTTQVQIDRRGNKLYLDSNQNDEADTVAAPYSVRPYKIPTVSTPVDWKEINSSLNPHDFTIHTIVKRIKKRGDIFSKVVDKKNAVQNSKKLMNFI